MCQEWSFQLHSNGKYLQRNEVPLGYHENLPLLHPPCKWGAYLVAGGTKWISGNLKAVWECVAAQFKRVTSPLCFALVCRGDESHFFQHFLTTQSKLNSKVKTSKLRCESYLYGLKLFLWSSNPSYRINAYTLKGRRGGKG